MKEPVKIDPKRLVLPLLMLIALIYAVRLTIRPSIKLIIHNQCLNVGLVSPIYITGNKIECHRPPKSKVCAGDRMKSSFTIKSDDKSYGVLIYKLQEKQKHESTEISKDTSNNVHLLVVWCILESDELYADVLLVEYDKGFTWNEDKLNKLHHENHDRLKKYDNTASYICFMNNNMALKTTFNVKYLKGTHELNISITEKREMNML
jgi:hypothetical protein